MDNDFTSMYYLTGFKIVSVELTTDGRMEIVKQYPADAIYPVMPPRSVPDKVIKEIYHVVDGKIKLGMTIEGTHTPSYNVAESIKFPEGK